MFLALAASTADIPTLPVVVFGVVAIVAIIFLLVRVLGVLSGVVMAINALLTNSGVADGVFRGYKGRRTPSRSSLGPRDEPRPKDGRPVGKNSTMRDLDKAFESHDRWFKAQLVPIGLVLVAVLFLSAGVGGRVRGVLAGAIGIALVAELGLLGMWLKSGLRYWRTLDRFRVVRGMPARGPRGIARLRVFVIAGVFSVVTAGVYLAAPGWRSVAWIAFVVIGMFAMAYILLVNRDP